MDHEYSQLQKEIKCQYNNIKKEQNQGSRLAYKLGTTRDEIRRNKDKSKMTMRVIRQTRSAVPSDRKRVASSAENRMDVTHGTSFSRKSNITQPPPGNPLRQKLGRVTQFNISGSAYKNQPINTRPGTAGSSSGMTRPSTAKSWTRADPLSRISSLTDIYNDHLEEVIAFD